MDPDTASTANVQLPEYPSTPPDAMAVSGDEDFSDFGGIVICTTVGGERREFECDVLSTVGWLRSSVARWLQVPTSAISLARGDRLLKRDLVKISDLLDGWESSPLGRYVQVIVDSSDLQ